MDHTTHQSGSFCTSVLRTRDIERASAFYSAIMGWTTAAVPGSSNHRLLQYGGKTVAGIQEISEGNDRWVPHVSVDDREHFIEAAVALGATLIDTTDISAFARIATLRDPEGALFGLWQPDPHQGAQLTEVVGSLWWIEVLSNNVAGAKEFYLGLFGWASRETAFEPFASYIVFQRGETQEGGILPIGEGWDVSPTWSSIFAVEDCDATLKRGEALGGCTFFVHTVPTAGRIGSLVDAGGAPFVVRGPVPA